MVPALFLPPFPEDSHECQSHALDAPFPVAEKPKPAALAGQPRLWPAVIIAAAYWIAWAIVTVFYPGTFVQFMVLFWTPMLMSAALAVWWLFFSSCPGSAAVGPGLPGTVLRRGLSAGAQVGELDGPADVCHAHRADGAVLWLVLTHGAKTLVGWLGLAAVAAVDVRLLHLVRVDGITGALVAAQLALDHDC